MAKRSKIIEDQNMAAVLCGSLVTSKNIPLHTNVRGAVPAGYMVIRKRSSTPVGLINCLWFGSFDLHTTLPSTISRLKDHDLRKMGGADLEVHFPTAGEGIVLNASMFAVPCVTLATPNG